MSKKNKILLFLVVIFCSTLIARPVGYMYDQYITPISNWFIGPSHPEDLTGFMLAFLFFGVFFSWLIADKKMKYSLLYTLPILLFLLLLGAFEELIIGLIIVFIGWLAAQGILCIKKLIKR